MEEQNALWGGRTKKNGAMPVFLLFYVIIPVFALFIFESAQKVSKGHRRRRVISFDETPQIINLINTRTQVYEHWRKEGEQEASTTKTFPLARVAGEQEKWQNL